MGWYNCQAMSPRAPNPFLVLELPVEASPREVDKQGQKWLAMLRLGMEAARQYSTPDGSVQPRDEAKVQWAMGELQDPVKRVCWELWATPAEAPAPPSPGEEPGVQHTTAPMPEARRLRWWM